MAGAIIDPRTLRFRRCQPVFGEFQGQNKGFEKVELVISPPVGEMAGRAEGVAMAHPLPALCKP
jgi:hypothetical protein